MYKIVELADTVRIPPEFIGQDLGKVMDKLVQQSFEGRLSKQHGMTVLTMDVEPIGEGIVIHGDGAIFQRVKFRALTFKPEVHEIVNGIICEVVEFGAFAHIGPLDALVHMSQVMNDFVSADVANERLTGKESGRALAIGDNVRARIVTASLNELSPRESKIGLTMRQPALGKVEWIDEDRARSKAGTSANADAALQERAPPKKQKNVKPS
ncbi:MAG TPA: DNA-directed RNA polymerase, partial [Candidatus Thermoplasmatota archaeon]|nr:DNA-directed RNA polymerase [Candidatus Thermoplasmatota archaeon]